MEKVTFLNDNSKGNLETIGRESLAGTAEVFRDYMNYGFDEDGLDEKLDQDAIEFFENNGPFHEYGYGVQWDDGDEGKPGFYQYVLSGGGPSDEIRFYLDYSGYTWKIEYFYKDWYCGVGFDVSTEDWAVWLEDHFRECGSFQRDQEV